MEPSEKNLFDLQVDHEASSYLSETAKWAKFLAIVGFIFCGLIVVLAMFAGSIMTSVMKNYSGDPSAAAMSTVGGAFLSIVYVLVALLYFFPCLYLFRFSTRMQTSIRSNDQRLLNSSFSNLKSCFKFMGILTIVVLACYFLALIGGIVAAVSFTK